MNADASLTVIVPTFEEPILLARALTSLRDQLHESLHVVVVNNGGDPAVVDQVVGVIASSSSPLASRIIARHRTKHDARGAVIREALQNVSTPFVAVLDESQSWQSSCASVAVKRLINNPETPAVCVGWSIAFEKMIEERVWPRRNDAVTLKAGDVSLSSLLSGVEIPQHAIVYRVSALTAVDGVNPSFEHLAMWDVNVRLATHADVVVEPSPLATLHVLEGTTEEEDERRHAIEAERQQLISSWMKETLPGGANKGQCALDALAHRNRESELQLLRDENAQLRREIANFNGLSSRALRAMLQPTKLVRAVQRRTKK
jgi:hypothetical protein